VHFFIKKNYLNNLNNLFFYINNILYTYKIYVLHIFIYNTQVFRLLYFVVVEFDLKNFLLLRLIQNEMCAIFSIGLTPQFPKLLLSYP